MITTPKPFFYKAVSMNKTKHIAKNIASEINIVINEIGISKVAVIITNNAANIKAAWKILQKKYSHKIFLKCQTHEIHLWIKDILNLL